jgi:protein O-GlcNAc transferase
MLNPSGERVMPEMNADMYWKLSQDHHRCGDLPAAINSMQHVIARQPHNAEAYYRLGSYYRTGRKVAHAVSCYRRAIQLRPDYCPAYLDLGLILLSRGMIKEAAGLFRAALKIEPENVTLLNNFGVACRELGELKKAATFFEKARTLQSDSLATVINLANTYRELGQYSKAMDHFRHALKLDPKNHTVLLGKGLVHMDLAQYASAVDSFEKALCIRPKDGMTLGNLVNALMQICAWSALDEWNPKLDRLTQEALKMGVKPDEMPFLNLSRHADPPLNLAVAKAWSKEVVERVAAVKARPMHRPGPRNHRRIHIGYLSNNFGNHPTAHLLQGFFNLHDRNKFKVFCYSYGEDDKSEFRRKIARDCDEFVDLQNLGDFDAADCVRRNEIDILIDLVGYMKGARPEICALRPAPLQIRWLGMPGTSGADFYDYFITDKIVTPPEESEFYTETLIHMPHCYQVNSYDPLPSAGSADRRLYGLPEEGVVFAAFHTAYKIDRVIFGIWMDILGKVPGSVLWLMPGSQEADRNLGTAAEKLGIVRKRLITAEKVAKNEHLHRLQCADILLDTARVNGAITISDALWSGVPVLTVKGRHFASRMAASILSAYGLSDLIADSLVEYKALAVDLAKDRMKIDALQKKIGTNRSHLPLFQTRKFVAELEKELARLWDRQCEGKG